MGGARARGRATTSQQASHASSLPILHASMSTTQTQTTAAQAMRCDARHVRGSGAGPRIPAGSSGPRPPRSARGRSRRGPAPPAASACPGRLSSRDRCVCVCVLVWLVPQSVVDSTSSIPFHDPCPASQARTPEVRGEAPLARPHGPVAHVHVHNPTPSAACRCCSRSVGCAALAAADDDGCGYAGQPPSRQPRLPYITVASTCPCPRGGPPRARRSRNTRASTGVAGGCGVVCLGPRRRSRCRLS